jgi:hypothetical protein
MESMITCATGAAASFRAEALRHRGEAVVENGGRLPDDDRGENYTLAAEASNADFG